jgi:hypothetical protein
MSSWTNIGENKRPFSMAEDDYLIVDENWKIEVDPGCDTR